MDYYIIFNPGARDGRSKKNFNRIEHFFSVNHLHFDLSITKNLDHAYSLSVEANKKSYHTIIAVGGDGTINRVLNGFYNGSGERTSHARLGILYTGTSPDFSKSYHIPYKTIGQSLNTIKRGKTKKIRVGKIILAKTYIPDTLKAVKGDTGFVTRYFGCCANIGLGATLAREANSGIRKILGDTAGTFVSLLKTLFRYKAKDITCYFDGVKRKINNMFNISIGKTYYIASGIKVNNSLTPDDNRFYNLLIKDLSFASLLSCIKVIYSGNKIINNNNISLSYSSKIEVESGGQCIEVEFDGDPQGFLPCSIETAEDTLDLIVGGQDG